MRTAARKDNSQRRIEQHLKALGIPFTDTSQLKNLYDMLVYFRGEIHVFEIKSREYASKANQLPKNRVNLLTPGERECYDRIWSTGVAYNIVFDSDEVLSIIGAT